MMKLMVSQMNTGARLPKFDNVKLEDGIILVTCADQFSKSWLVENFDQQTSIWEGANLIISEASAIPRRETVIVFLPGCVMEKILPLKCFNGRIKILKWITGEFGGWSQPKKG